MLSKEMYVELYEQMATGNVPGWSYDEYGNPRFFLQLLRRGASFFSSHVEPALNDEPHVYRDANGADRATIEGYTAQLVGGGTQLYGGVSLRFTPTDLRLKSFNASRRTPLQNDPNGDALAGVRDWPVTYDELEPYYALA